VKTITKPAEIRLYYGNWFGIPGQYKKRRKRCECLRTENRLGHPPDHYGSAAVASVPWPETGQTLIVTSWKSTNVLRRLLLLMALACACGPAWSAGTAAGTVINNTATVDFLLAGTPVTQTSNVASITVVERVDVVVTLQSGQVIVAPGEADRSLLFTVTNTGNGNETFTLAMDSVLAGDDFDPQPAVPGIYFDTDSSGDFTPADLAYNPGNNDPQLAADAAIDVLLVNDIPGAVVNGNVGRSELTATSSTGTGVPGAAFPGLGDGGVDAVIGATGGEAAQTGEYVVGDVQVDIIKSVAISDPFGGTQPTPGATLTYTVTVEVMNTGTTSGSVLRDPIPANTTYVAGSISLNGGPLSDPIDADAGELDTSGAPTVVVRLGDLIQGNGIQTITFAVTID